MGCQLPVFKTLYSYRYPSPDHSVPISEIPSEGLVYRHGAVDLLIAPDLVEELHSPGYEGHATPYTGYHSILGHSTAPETLTMTAVDGKRVITKGGRVDLCHVILASGKTHQGVIGTKQATALFLRPPPCPDATDTGYYLHVASGYYTLQGECGGDRRVVASDGQVNLDPARLLENLAQQHEWTVVRPANSSDFRYQITRRTTPAPTFTLQQFVVGPDLQTPGTWNDITSSVIGLQAGVRLRPKPEA